MPEQSLQESFPEVFEAFRFWRILHWISWIFFLAVAVIVIGFGMASGPHHPIPWWPDLTFMIGSMGFVIMSYAMLRFLRCPRCHNDLFTFAHSYPIFLRKGCYHCGLPIYSADEGSTSDDESG